MASGPAHSSREMRGNRARLGLVLLMAGAVALGGCAAASPRPLQSSATAAEEPENEAASDQDIEPTVVAYRDYRDPLIRLNRAVFAFNDFTYRHALIPLSNVYLQAPDPVRRSVGNFF